MSSASPVRDRPRYIKRTMVLDRPPMRILSPSRRKKDCFDFNRNQNCAPPLVAGGGDMRSFD